MAKRRKIKRKTKRKTFSFGVSKKKKRRTISRQFISPVVFLKFLAGFVILGGIVAGFIFMERYVEDTTGVSQKTGVLELVNAPGWVTESLKEKIYAAARADGEDLKLDGLPYLSDV